MKWKGKSDLCVNSDIVDTVLLPYRDIWKQYFQSLPWSVEIEQIVDYIFTAVTDVSFNCI